MSEYLIGYIMGVGSGIAYHFYIRSLWRREAHYLKSFIGELLTELRVKTSAR